ncbi:hypothetical protein [Halostagnicola kamekurae]|uniref:Uncharacterized protein n=1 Tax=Halostagnicola kamekurae TaxID=619731 RepID=A0A1I6U429_9EURY|nr:hypothetical protein [Halostagnicola kamekurae]SFS96128.1 hypothetical protein SAMN04488556_3528 [Halostagnicola kamekurae]
MNRQLAWGIGTLVLGVICLVALGVSGAFQDPFGSGLQNRPVNSTAIGGSLLLTVAGGVTIARARSSE